MGRQPFRRSKSDGTLDDGTGGGGNTSGMPIVGDQTNNYTNFYIMSNSWGTSNTAKDFDAEFFGSGYGFYYMWIIPKTGTLTGLYAAISLANTLTNAVLRGGLYDIDANGECNELQYYVDIDLSACSSAALFGSTSWKDADGSSISAPTVTRGEQYMVGWVQTNSTANSNKPKIWHNYCPHPTGQIGMGQMNSWGNPSTFNRVTVSSWSYTLPKSFGASDNTTTGVCNKLWMGTSITSKNYVPKLCAKITE